MISLFIRGMSFGGSLIIAIGARKHMVHKTRAETAASFYHGDAFATIDASLNSFGCFWLWSVIREIPDHVKLGQILCSRVSLAYRNLSFRAALKNNQINSLAETQTTSRKFKKNYSRYSSF